MLDGGALSIVECKVLDHVSSERRVDLQIMKWMMLSKEKTSRVGRGLVGKRLELLVQPRQGAARVVVQLGLGAHTGLGQCVAAGRPVETQDTQAGQRVKLEDKVVVPRLKPKVAILACTSGPLGD